MRYVNTQVLIVVFSLVVALFLYGVSKNFHLKGDSGSLVSETKVGFSKDEVEKYIKQNISSLSHERPVLGGTFYVTEIVWGSETKGLVSYEDGHIAVESAFTVIQNDDKGFSVLFDKILPE